MIKIENTDTYGWEHAIRGMRNPMNSWNKSDSGKCSYPNNSQCKKLKGRCNYANYENISGFCIGNNDLDLMKKLAKAGTDHRKFMRMIVVYADVTAPLYWWKEFDTYKVGTVANSCSTMHKIDEKEFTMDDFSHEHLSSSGLYMLEQIVSDLNSARYSFLNGNKSNWWDMIQLLPSSYNQKRTVMINYEVLANMYHSRKNHKLAEWREFCRWVEALPYSELITGRE